MKNQDYETFGDYWKKEMTKLPKAMIIDIAQKIGKEMERLKELEKENKMLERLIDRNLDYLEKNNIRCTWVNVYKDDEGRFLGDAEYDTFKSCYENRDKLNSYIETAQILRGKGANDN